MKAAENKSGQVWTEWTHWTPKGQPKKAKADSGNGQRLYVKAYSLFFYELFKQFVNFQKGS